MRLIRADQFTPRPATCSIKVEGVSLFILRLTKDQAADMARTFTLAQKKVSEDASRKAFDDEVADLIIAGVQSEIISNYGV